MSLIFEFFSFIFTLLKKLGLFKEDQSAPPFRNNATESKRQNTEIG